jgi:hypothetical protein
VFKRDKKYPIWWVLDTFLVKFWCVKSEFFESKRKILFYKIFGTVAELLECGEHIFGASKP